MKRISCLIALLGMRATALNISQDQGQLNVQYARLDRPYVINVAVPSGCPSDLVGVSESAGQITIKHRAPCPTGAKVSIKVNRNQDLTAFLEAGSLEFAEFDGVREWVGRFTAESKVGTVSVPSLAGFTKTFDNYVGRGYRREGHVEGARVELKVGAGLVQVNR